MPRMAGPAAYIGPQQTEFRRVAICPGGGLQAEWVPSPKGDQQAPGQGQARSISQTGKQT